jgi:hypothetical protein
MWGSGAARGSPAYRYTPHGAGYAGPIPAAAEQLGRGAVRVGRAVRAAASMMAWTWRT